jgi:hypothetical protein
MVNFKFACRNKQPEMRLDYSGTKIIQIFTVTNTFSHWLSRGTSTETFVDRIVTRSLRLENLFSYRAKI